jgi:hypothetical protein
VVSVLAIVGLALVLALQVAIHLRLANVPARAAARLKAEAEARARAAADADANALQTAISRRVGQLVTELQRFHDFAAEDFRARVAATEQRTRVAEARSKEGAQVMTGLRAHACEIAALVAELRTLVGEAADLAYTLAERRSGAAPAPEEKPASPALDEIGPAAEAESTDEGDQRKTTEMPRPPTSCAPPADAEADDEGWDNPHERTKVWPKAGTSAAAPGVPREAHAVLPGQTPAPPRPRARVEPRRALPPPAQAGEDDAPERPSVFLPAPPSEPEGRE